MKYIRTKDGRITTLKDELIDNVELWVSGGKENILKITDTIEELCDEFVFEDTDKYKRIIENFGIAKTLNSGNLYGAIWTEWGLKYVAKMNDGGELELICK